jgi:hypothetical protein
MVPAKPICIGFYRRTLPITIIEAVALSRPHSSMRRGEISRSAGMRKIAAELVLGGYTPRPPHDGFYVLQPWHSSAVDFGIDTHCVQ